MALQSALNIKTANWGTPFDAVVYSNILAAVFLAFVGLIPLLLTLFYCSKRKNLSDSGFQSKYGAPFLDSDLEKDKMYVPIIFTAIFFLRRSLFVASVLLMDE